MGTTSLGIAVTALAVAFLPPQAAPAPHARVTMRLAVYDDAGVSEGILKEAKSVVRRVFGQAGIETDWMDVARFIHEMPTEIAERRAYVGSIVQVRLLRARPGARAGHASHVAGAAGGTLRAWVDVRRVEELAKEGDYEVNDVLGYVIVHEIGHLLLPPGAHAVAGIMAPTVDTRLAKRRQLYFHPEQAMLIRARLAGK